MTKTSKPNKRTLQASGKAALSDARLEAARGGSGCASGAHYPIVIRP